jgi:ATP-dependent RNA helicase DeaD
MQTYRVEVGDIHGVKAGNIVGAIANEAGIDGKHIGRVVIRSDHSFVDLPEGMPKEIFRTLQKVRVGGQQLQISLALRTQAEKLRRERPTERGTPIEPRSGAAGRPERGVRSHAKSHAPRSSAGHAPTHAPAKGRPTLHSKGYSKGAAAAGPKGYSKDKRGKSPRR